MIIGVDFDNTIVSYGSLFHRLAREKNLIPADVPENKQLIRDYLRGVGREPDWTALQGDVYGPSMSAADAYPGVHDFFRACRERGQPVSIISHKTRQPFAGPPCDLHEAARKWLRLQGFFDPAGIGLPEARAFFELTRDAKIARIRAEGCTVFIDDLPEFLLEKDFPTSVRRLLFDPEGTQPANPAYEKVSSWAELRRILLA